MREWHGVTHMPSHQPLESLCRIVTTSLGFNLPEMRDERKEGGKKGRYEEKRGRQRKTTTTTRRRRPQEIMQDFLPCCRRSILAGLKVVDNDCLADGLRNQRVREARKAEGGEEVRKRCGSQAGRGRGRRPLDDLLQTLSIQTCQGEQGRGESGPEVLE